MNYASGRPKLFLNRFSDYFHAVFHSFSDRFRSFVLHVHHFVGPFGGGDMMVVCFAVVVIVIVFAVAVVIALIVRFLFPSFVGPQVILRNLDVQSSATTNLVERIYLT